MNELNWLAAPLALGLVLLGVWWLAALDHLLATRAATGRWRAGAVLEPWRSGLHDLLQEFRSTERPDLALWLTAPVLLVILTLAALTVFPLGPELIGFDSSVGVVLMTAMFALVLVAAFWAGWGPNSKFPLIAGYRFIGLMLAYEMPLAITIIAVALPAQSLALGQIVLTQQLGLWNIVLQPLGLVIYLICALAVPFRGPFDVVNSPDLAGGPLAELSGAPRLLWRFGQYALLLTLAAFTVPLFLGGGAGPWLPAWLWTVLKVMAVSGLLVWAGRRLARLPLDGFMKWAWVALIPLSLFNLFLVGLLILIWPELAGKVR